MSWFIILLPVAAAAPIVYFACSKKTSSLIRKTALAALILILLASAVSAFLILSGFQETAGAVRELSSAYPEEAPKTDIKNILIFGAVLLLLIMVIILFAIRESLAVRRKARIGGVKLP